MGNSCAGQRSTNAIRDLTVYYPATRRIRDVIDSKRGNGNMSLLHVEIAVMILAAFILGLVITWSLAGRQTS
jgi:hypothetical protein